MTTDTAPTGRRDWIGRLRGISFRWQLMLSTAATGAAVALALILVTQFALAQSADDSLQRVLSSRADAVVSSTDDASRDGGLRVPDDDLDAGVAVYDSNGSLVAGSVPPSLAAAYASLSSVIRPQLQRAGDVDLWAEPFQTRSGTGGVIVLSERLQPYQDAQAQVLWITVAAGILIIGLATFFAGWASRRALAPVARMAATAEAWSEQNLDRRFDLGPPTNEIRALGHTLDGLLERVHRVILDEQRLTSELAHELRSPLAAIAATADLIAMRDDLDPELRTDLQDMLGLTRVMAATITSLVDLARQRSGDERGESAGLEDVVREIGRATGSGGTLEVSIPEHAVVAAPADLVARALSPVIENALQRADHVQVSAIERRLDWDVVIVDDGPGVAPELAQSLFTPGAASGSGSGLGLALARRVARSIGGDVRVDTSEDGSAGARFVVRLPRWI